MIITKPRNIECPHCNEEQSTKFRFVSNCCGVLLTCENPACKKEFELILEGGNQIKLK